MDTIQLQHFAAVAEELNFTRAAKNLNVPRMTVSLSVKNLEAELGYALFDRSTDVTRLTKAGVALLSDIHYEAEKNAPPPPPPGGKAKASKGKGRTPAVKGAPRVGKKRQSR